MNTQDFQDQSGNRARAIARLSELCVAEGLNYHFIDKQFIVDLPPAPSEEKAEGATYAEQ